MLVFTGCSSRDDQPNHVVEIPESTTLSDRAFGLLRNGSEINLANHEVTINDDARSISISGDAFDTTVSGDELLLISDPETNLAWTLNGNVGSFTWFLDNSELSAALHFKTLEFQSIESGIETDYSSVDLTVENLPYGDSQSDNRFGFKLTIDSLVTSSSIEIFTLDNGSELQEFSTDAVKVDSTVQDEPDLVLSIRGPDDLLSSVDTFTLLKAGSHVILILDNSVTIAPDGINLSIENVENLKRIGLVFSDNQTPIVKVITTPTATKTPTVLPTSTTPIATVTPNTPTPGNSGIQPLRTAVATPVPSVTPAPATLTPVSTATATPTPTQVPPPTQSPTVEPTSLPQPDSSPTPTQIPASATTTAVVILTPTASPTPTPSPTPTASPTPTPSPTPTASPTTTPTPGPSPTPPPTAFPTATITPPTTPTPVPPTLTPVPTAVTAGQHSGKYGVVSHTSDESETSYFINTLGAVNYMDFSSHAASAGGAKKLLHLGLYDSGTVFSASQIEALVNASPGSVWYIGGEPNVNNQTPMSILVNQLNFYYTTIKATDPTALIASPAVLNWEYLCNSTCVGYMRGVDWIDSFRSEYMSAYGTEPPVDIWSIDLYPLDWVNIPNVNSSIPIEEIVLMRAYLNTVPGHGDTPIWIMEFGLHWGYTGIDWTFSTCGQVMPLGTYDTEGVINYLDEVYTWLEINSANLNVEKWFTFITYWDIIGCVNSDPHKGMSLFDSPNAGASLTDVGQWYKTRSSP